MEYLEDAIPNLSDPKTFKEIWNAFFMLEDTDGLIRIEDEVEYVASAKLSQDPIIKLDTVLMKNEPYMFIITIIFDESEIIDDEFLLFDKVIDEKYNMKIMHVAIDTTPYKIQLFN